MNDEPQGGGLVRRVTELAAKLPAAPLELVERIQSLRAQAHVLSPAVTAASIPPHIRINTVVEVIDTTFDPKTGRGNDVYFQASIHKSDKKGYGDDAVFTPLEVSLNATCIKRILAAAGVSVTHSDQIPTSDQNHWKWQSRGKMRDFDGSWRDLPPGTAEIDFRDGSAQIGEWTPDKRAEHVAAAAKKADGMPQKERWKAKPAPIGGWTGDRVMSARRFGLRLAEAKSLNALGRNFGLKQIYSLEELKKPFVIFRATFSPDMSDPDIKKMVTAAELGATNLLFPSGGPVAPALPPAAEAALPDEAHDETPHTIDGEVVNHEDPLPFEPEPAAPAEPPTFTISGVFRQTDGGFYLTTFQTKAERLTTPDQAIATAAHKAFKASQPVHLELQQTDSGRVVLKLTAVDEGY